MKREAEVRDLFIANAIRLIAEGGFENATTKALTLEGGHLPNLKMNEAYIYRLFGSKERLYESAFQLLDQELYQVFATGSRMVGGFESDTREKFWKFFLIVWPFLLGNEDRCRCYVRYYYSVYFKGDSLISHKKQFRGMVEAVAPLFKEEADVASILHSVFTALFDFAIRVYNGELEDNEINRPHIFNVLYCMMMTYFKETEKVS